jgi:hypothetical protein
LDFFPGTTALSKALPLSSFEILGEKNQGSTYVYSMPYVYSALRVSALQICYIIPNKYTNLTNKV